MQPYPQSFEQVNYICNTMQRMLWIRNPKLYPPSLAPLHLYSYSASRDNWCTVGGDGGCRVGEVRAGTTSPMPDHKGFKLQ